MKINTNFVKIRNLNIEYIYQGKGDDFLFLHGGGGSFRFYKRFINELSKYYRVWAPSLPGAGKSSKLPKDWKFDDYAKVIKDFTKHLNIKPILAGHSFGGAVAIRLKSKYPDLFKTLILMSSAGVKHDRPLRIIFKAVSGMVYEMKRGDKKKGDDLLVKEAKVNLENHPIDLLKMGNQFCNLDLSKDLKNIKDKVIVLWGREDEALNYKDYQKICNFLVNEKPIIVEGDHCFVVRNFKKVAKIIDNELNNG